MPLIVVCGQPCSGKSSVARKLAHLLDHFGPVSFIDEPSLHLDRNIAYQDSVQEKNTRAALKSAVERATSKRSFTILDSLNNIKGYRYELWCVARTSGTRYCMVHVDTPVETCRQWNAARGSGAGGGSSSGVGLRGPVDGSSNAAAANAAAGGGSTGAAGALIGSSAAAGAAAGGGIGVVCGESGGGGAGSRSISNGAPSSSGGGDSGSAGQVEGGGRGGGAAADAADPVEGGTGGSCSYRPDVFEDLAGRFEPPDSRNRWDSPLFRVQPGSSDEDAVLRAVAACMAGQELGGAGGGGGGECGSDAAAAAAVAARSARDLRPTCATTNPTLLGTNVLHDVDRAVQDVIQRLTQVQALACGGPAGLVDFGPGVGQLQLQHPVPMAVLRNHKRAFLKLATKASASRLQDSASATRVFVDYLRQHLAMGSAGGG